MLYCENTPREVSLQSFQKDVVKGSNLFLNLTKKSCCLNLNKLQQKSENNNKNETNKVTNLKIII